MAWVRTAVSLISFGFTIHKFFDYMRQQGTAKLEARLFGPREYALFMIGIGLAALLMATLQHRSYVSELRKEDPTLSYSLATVIAGLVSVLGIVTFIVVMFRQ
jgi:putative membrane protein